jgi:hypothetical protein
MKLKYILPLIVLLAMVSAIYAKSDLFKKQISIPPASTVYVSMAYPAQLDGVKAFDVFTGAYVSGKLNADRLWELNLDPAHRYHIEVLYNSAQGSFSSINFAGTTKKLQSASGAQWYRVTSKAAAFTNGSSYVLYGCQGTNCFE